MSLQLSTRSKVPAQTCLFRKKKQLKELWLMGISAEGVAHKYLFHIVTRFETVLFIHLIYSFNSLDNVLF